LLRGVCCDFGTSRRLLQATPRPPTSPFSSSPSSSSSSSSNLSTPNPPVYLLILCGCRCLLTALQMVAVRSGQYLARLETLLQHCVTHVLGCPLCTAKGFICEICNRDDDVLFPFQLHKTVQCRNCNTVYHRQCFEKVRYSESSSKRAWIPFRLRPSPMPALRCAHYEYEIWHTKKTQSCIRLRAHAYAHA